MRDSLAGEQGFGIYIVNQPHMQPPVVTKPVGRKPVGETGSLFDMRFGL